MPSITHALPAILRQVRRPGDFYATGTLEVHLPRLEVAGVGAIALPLLAAQAEQLIAVAEQAPYGRGSETLIDTDVRRTWQVGAERVRISGKAWDQGLAATVEQAAVGLGVSGPVEATLYKLLVYDTGSFFVRHRDSEKAPGMFATLVVVLPSEHSGGELVVRHQGREARLDLRRDEPSAAAFAAFYADCVHEVCPIVSGYRLALIYNLVRTGKGPLPKPPDYAAEQQELVALLREWSAEPGAPGGPPETPVKLIYPLEHAYTPAELAFATLKGADAAVAGVIVDAALQADWELYLALVSVAERGIAEHTGRGYWRGAADDLEVGEVTDTSWTVAEWRHPDGSRPPMGTLPFCGEELAPPDAFDGLEPTELDLREATGNEGASFDRLYQRAALVLWPRSHRVAVLAQGGLKATVPFLGELARQWQGSGVGPEAPVWREAHALASQIQRDWPATVWGRQLASKAGQAAAFLAHLAVLGDAEVIHAFLAEQVASGAYSGQDNEALVTALGRLPAARAGERLTAIVTHNAPAQPVACADLLARSAAASADPTGDLGAAALALVESLPVAPPRARMDADGRWLEAPTADMVVDMLGALARVDPALGDRALAHFRSHPEAYDMDGVLVPAALQLHGSAATRPIPCVQDLRAAVLAHLRQRIAVPLEPPADWRRPSAIACTCAHCTELSRFLDDPAQPVWSFKASEAARRHVEGSIQGSRCDLDCVTERWGRPYTLRCTKNQASYLGRVRQRQQDLAHLVALDGEGGAGTGAGGEG